VPFVIGVIGDFSGAPAEPLPQLRKREFLEIDRENFDHRLKAAKPRVAFEVEAQSGPNAGELAVELCFESLEDFQPEAVARRAEGLSGMFRLRRALAEVRDKLRASPEITETLLDFLGSVPLQVPPPNPETVDSPTRQKALAGFAGIASQLNTDPERACELVNALRCLGEKDEALNRKNLISRMEQKVAELDVELGWRLNAILHHPNFKQLESSWQGLHYLTERVATSERLKIKMLNVTKRELMDDFRRSGGFNRSVMFSKVYDDEFLTFGGSPYSLLVGDFYIDASGLLLADQLARVAASSSSVFLTGLAPSAMNMDSTLLWLGMPCRCSRAILAIFCLPGSTFCF
jgi:type VI secretion system protein ImpC